MKSQSRRAALYAIALGFPFYSACPDLIGNNFGTATIYDINTATGAATNPRSTGLTSGLTGITYDPGSGIVYGLTALNGDTPNALVTIDPVTGATVVVGSTPAADIVEGDIALNPVNGRLYGADDILFQIDPLTGALMGIGLFNPTFDLTDFSALAFDRFGTLYIIDSVRGANAILSIVDPATAMLVSSVTMNVSLGSTAALAFDPISGTAYLVDGGTSRPGTNMLYTLDTGTGVATAIGPLGVEGGLAGLAFAPQVSVPEIPSWILLLLGLTATFGLRPLLSRRG
jgi:hypothetical protein